MNQEKTPSSVPSIISTELSRVKNDAFLKTSFTDSSNFSDWSKGNILRPAVALNTTGVFDQYSSGISFLAFSKRDTIVAAP